MTIPEITVDELAELGPDTHVVDVREDHEWAQGHVPHAVHVPLDVAGGMLAWAAADHPVEAGVAGGAGG